VPKTGIFKITRTAPNVLPEHRLTSFPVNDRGLSLMQTVERRRFVGFHAGSVIIPAARVFEALESGSILLIPDCRLKGPSSSSGEP
jgi:hypothetical protein